FGFVHAVDPLVGNHCPRHLFVVARIILDQQHLGRLTYRLAILDEVDATIVHGFESGMGRTWRISGQEMIVRRTRRVGKPSDTWRVLVSWHGLWGRHVKIVGKGCQAFQSVGAEAQSLVVVLIPLVEFERWRKCRRALRSPDGHLGIRSKGFGQSTVSAS